MPRATRPSSPAGAPGASAEARNSSASGARPATARPSALANQAKAATQGSLAPSTAREPKVIMSS